MGHGTKVGGANKLVTGGFTKVGGVNKKITKGLTLVGGVQKVINFSSGQLLGNLAVGTSVFAPFNGKLTEFIVIHQGLPSSIYDSSCTGTWLVMKDIYSSTRWHSSNRNAYAESTTHTDLNSTILNLFGADVKSQIKSVKIPYFDGLGDRGSVVSGSNGLLTQIFLLSAYEVGYTTANNQYVPIDGACLSYFSSDSRRVAYLNGTATKYYLRSPYAANTSHVWCVGTSGAYSTSACSTAAGIRFAFILPQDAAVDENFQIIAA